MFITKRMGKIWLATLLSAALVQSGFAGDTSEAGYEREGQSQASTSVEPSTAAAPVVSKAPDEELRVPIDEISVYGRARPDTLRDIPQSATVFNQQIMDSIDVDNVGDVIRLVPNSSRAGSSLSAFGDSFTIRGFSANQTVNGIGINSINHARSTVNVERVEVLQGPASVLYGQMEPGAVINIVTKRPRDEFHAEAGVEFGSYDHMRFTADVGGQLNDRIGVRLNTAYREAESFYVNYDVRHVTVAPVIEFDISDTTTLILDGVYSGDQWTGFPNGAPAQGAEGVLPNPNGNYPSSFNPEESDSDTERENTNLGLRLLHDFNDTMSGRLAYTYTRNDRFFIEYFSLGLQDDLRTLNREVFYSPGDVEKQHLLNADLTGEFNTGGIRHKFVVGMDHRVADGHFNTQFFDITPIDMYEPVYGTFTFPGFGVMPLNDFTSDFEAMGVFLQNRVSIGDRLNLIAGVRYSDSKLEGLFIRGTTGQESEEKIEETDWSTQFGILYDVADWLSVFANRAESFVPQAGTTAGGSPFPSESGEQYEVGGKFDIGDSGLVGNAALFQITKDNVITVDPNNPGFLLPVGEVRSRGLELSVQGRLASNWHVLGGLSYMDTEVTKNNHGLLGFELRNAPDMTFSLLSRYDISSGPFEGLGFSAAVEHVSSRFGDVNNTFKLPSFTRADIGAYYTVNENVEVSLNLNNLTDELIYTGFRQDSITLDEDRTFLAKIRLTM